MSERAKANGHFSGMAGEFLVAGKLFKMGHEVAVTFGNAKATDLFVRNVETGRQFCVQVKTLRSKNCFPLNPHKIQTDHIYVFVILNVGDPHENYYVVTGAELQEKTEFFFGQPLIQIDPSKMPAVRYGAVRDYDDKWDLFNKPEAGQL
jgi:hypothetical protein